MNMNIAAKKNKSPSDGPLKKLSSFWKTASN
jgi:hypothetical protein